MSVEHYRVDGPYTYQQSPTTAAEPDIFKVKITGCQCHACKGTTEGASE